MRRMTRLPPLHLLIAFEAIARLGSVSKAAAELHLTTSAVSHRLSVLHDMLNVRLVVKTHEGMALTPEGERYSRALQGVLRQVADLSKCLDDSMDQDTVRLRVGPAFGEFWLLPRLGDFRDKHPKIGVELDLSLDPVDFRKEPLDLWVHRGTWLADGMTVERLFAEHFVPLAAPGYLKKHPIQTFGDLLQQAKVYCNRNSPHWSEWFRAQALPVPEMDWNLAFSQAGHSMQAAAQGLGVVLESLEISEPFRKDKRLIPVFEDGAVIDGPGYALIYPQQHLHRPAVATFRSWLGSMASS